MRILIVAMSDSIHTARWISQLTDQGWDISLYPSQITATAHQNLPDIKLNLDFYSTTTRKKFSWLRGIPVINDKVALLLEFVCRKSRKCRDLHFKGFVRHIQSFKPDIIHSLEIQQAGYLTLQARQLIGNSFPKWVVTNWGSDIYLFCRLAEHESRIRKVLELCDYYSCECKRDVCLAKCYGLADGKDLPVFPNSGGFDLKAIRQLQQKGPVSKRQIIMLKGYQHWAGRALVGLRALERCADILSGYEVYIYSAYPDVVLASELFSVSTGIPVKIIPPTTSQLEILRHHGHARISIGLSISDAISTSFIEAVVMGSFPIQSRTACADEWIEDGVSGLLVPPEDPEIIEKAIRLALLDDSLVDHAAVLNRRLAEERLDQAIIKPKAIDLYKTVYHGTTARKDI